MPSLLSTRDYRKFLTLLKDARIAADLTQLDLALSLKSTQSFVSKVERGERRLDVVELRSWCKAIGIEFSKFIKKLDASLGGDT